jgi:hypothetical protein
MDEEMASRIVNTLYQAGVLEKAVGNIPAAPATVDGNFFEQISRELTWSMGPLSEIILSEEIGALGETQEQFPRSRISELVERVTEAILDESERIRFQQIMLEVIRKL